MHILKRVAFLYTDNAISGSESKKQSLLTYHEEKEKHLGINLTKVVKDLYSENYKTSIKETEDD